MYVFILSPWAEQEGISPKSIQGEFTFDQVIDYNSKGYNIYHYANSPSKEVYDSLPNNPHTGSKRFIKAEDIDQFHWVFMDLDMKHGAYETKEKFIELVLADGLAPTRIVDSGNGIHMYYRVSDLDAMSYLRLSRRLARRYNTDTAVCQIKQLMRVPNTANTKDKDNFKLCEVLHEDLNTVYDCETLDKFLPRITPEDEDFCQNHYNMAYNPEAANKAIKDEIPAKFANLIRTSEEAKKLWIGENGDRSKSDYRLAHLMLANGFTGDEARSVLVNSRKALDRAPIHRYNYANNIVEKVWAFENPQNTDLTLSSSVLDILSRKPEETNLGARFECSQLVDATAHGFRLSQVLGLVGGSGAGKTAFSLNLFYWFVERNPDYVHFFVTLEQPEEEIAARWASMCGSNTLLHDKVQVLGNYNKDGSYRNLSLDEIKDYILQYQKATGKKAGCVVIDHIGALKKKTKDGENQALIDICHQMKAFAVQTNTFLVMQSQTSREKAGIGDIELDKDAAYGTTTFEWYVDFLVTIWQPLKRVYAEADNMTVTAFKFCKIRKKDVKKDKIKEDVRYKLIYDPKNEMFRELTQDEQESFKFFNNKATNMRKQDKKTDVLEYKSIDWMNSPKEPTSNGAA